MKWSEINEPLENFKPVNDYIFLKTPIGVITIEWSTIETPYHYDTFLNGVKGLNGWLDSQYSLEEAKQNVVDYLQEKVEELQDFLNN